MDKLSLWVDTAEPRVTKEFVATWNYGRQGDSYGVKDGTRGWPTRNNIYCEPTTGTLIKLPACLDPLWATTGTGIYAPTRLSDFTPDNVTDGGWNLEYARDHSDDWRIQGQGLNADAGLITNAEIPANSSVYFAYGTSTANDKDAIWEIVWGETGFAIRIFASGRIEVYTPDVETPEDLQWVGDVSGTASPSETANGGWIGLFIAPFGSFEILIQSSLGGSFIFKRTDIEEGEPVLPAANIGFRTLTGGRADFACQVPALYHESGYAIGTPFKLKFGPETTLNPSYFAHIPDGSTDALTVSAVKLDDDGTAWASGDDDGRTKVSLSGNNTHSTWVYAAGAFWYPESDHAEDELEIPYEMWEHGSLNISYGDHPQDAKAEFAVFDPESETLPDGLATEQGCSSDVRLGDRIILQGSIYAKDRDKVFTNSEAEKQLFEIRGVWDRLKTERIDSTIAADGHTITAYLTKVATAAGIEDRFACSSDSFTFDFGGGRDASGLFGVTADAGDSFADALERVHSDFCATWFFGIELQSSGAPILALRAPADLESTPCIRLYFDTDAAEGDGLSAVDARTRTIQKWQEGILLPEANEVWVLGFDPRTGKPLVGFSRDSTLQDPTTPRGARPLGWRGCKDKYGLQDPAITTQNMVERAVTTLRDRLIRTRTIATCTGGMWIDDDGIPVIGGRLVEVQFPDESLRLFRVKKMRCRSMAEPQDPGAEFTAGIGGGSLLRQCEYVLEEEPDADGSAGGLSRLGGNWNAKAICESHRSLNQYVGDWKNIMRRFKGSDTWTMLEPSSVTSY